MLIVEYLSVSICYALAGGRLCVCEGEVQILLETI